MTRGCFIENVNSWSELIDFCYDEDCDLCEDIYTEESKDEEVDEQLADWIDDYSWREIYNMLEEIPTGYDYYYQDDSGDWYEADDYLFDERKEKVLQWMDEGEYWDDDEDDEDDPNDDCGEEWFEDESIPSDIDFQEFENLLVG